LLPDTSGFGARVTLERWQPRIIVATGSSGKTTLLHMLEAQLGGDSKVSHHANSAFGVPFDLLGLHGIKKTSDWFAHALLAPIRSLTYAPDKHFYLVEVDAERPKRSQILS
jgi:hypothetical protein